MKPTPGTVVLIGPACSPQFRAGRELRVRIVSVDDRPTYAGWMWLTGYVLGPKGDAVDKRELFVQAAGLKVLALPAVTVPAPARPTRARVRARN